MTRRLAGSAAGTSVAELLAATTLGLVLTATTVPSMRGAQQVLAVRSVAARVAADFREASVVARTRQRSVGWQVASAPLSVRVVEDGDGDGLRRDDVEAGTDPVLFDWVPLGAGAPPVVARVGCSCPAVDGAGTLAPGDRGMRFGSSSFVSFSAEGTASAGTLYLSSLGGPTVAVRVLGTTGRVRVLEYEPAAGWVER